MFAMLSMLLKTFTGGRVKVWHVLLAWSILAVIGLAMLGGIVYVVAHFVIKFW
jgi:hypothetical protein